MGEEHDLEVVGEEDEGVEAFLRSFRYHMRRLRWTDRPDSLMMGKENQERLAEYLGELQCKEDTNDRYVAALRGETLTRKPYVRIQEVPKQSDTEATLEQKVDKEVK